MNKEVKEVFKGDKACKPHLYTYVKNYNSTVKRGLKFISSGQYGEVYTGCIDKECKKPIAIKITTEPSAKLEFNIAKKLNGLGVPEMYHFKSCKDGNDILFYEYIDGQVLNRFVKNPISRDVYKSIMVQVLYNLYRIQKKFPSFRHHDLHGGNIMIRKVPVKDITIDVGVDKYTISNAGVEPIIIDFGFSTISGIKNPKVESEERRNIGIYRKSPKFYDVHFFLITMFSIVNPPSDQVQSLVRTFITNILPSNYLVTESNKLKQMRLRGNMGINHSKNIPNLVEILTKPFFTNKKIQYKIPTPISKPATLKVNKPTNGGKTALQKAMEVLAKNKAKMFEPIKKPLAKKQATPKPVKNSKTPQVGVHNVFTNKNGELKIDNKKCRLYTKDQLCMIIKNLSKQ